MSQSVPYHTPHGVTVITGSDGYQDVVIGESTSPKIRREAIWIYRILPSAASDPILNDMIERVEAYHALKY